MGYLLLAVAFPFALYFFLQFYIAAVYRQAVTKPYDAINNAILYRKIPAAWCSKFWLYIYKHSGLPRVRPFAEKRIRSHAMKKSNKAIRFVSSLPSLTEEDKQTVIDELRETQSIWKNEKRIDAIL